MLTRYSRVLCPCFARWWVLICLALFPAVLAHQPSDSYLSLTISSNQLEGQWDIALRDLDFFIELDTDKNGEITWGELESKQSVVESFAYTHLRLITDQTVLPAQGVDLLVAEHNDGSYAVLRFTAPLSAQAQELRVEYSLLFETDLQHRGFYQILHRGKTQSGVFSPVENVYRCALGNAPPIPSANQGFPAFLIEGVWHIWKGFDHILFLLALLLPSVLRRVDNKWVATASLRSATIAVLKVVTAFTIAHSITLTLAVLGFIHLPSRFIESTIAASVVLAACNNIRPILVERGWIVAFIFGLIHGFGFASVLVDLGLPVGSLAAALLGFNLGVELGQLAIVAAFLPVAFSLRRTWFYQCLTLRFGSAAIAILAALWMCERIFILKILPF